MTQHVYVVSSSGLSGHVHVGASDLGPDAYIRDLAESLDEDEDALTLDGYTRTADPEPILEAIATEHGADAGFLEATPLAVLDTIARVPSDESNMSVRDELLRELRGA